MKRLLSTLVLLTALTTITFAQSYKVTNVYKKSCYISHFQQLDTEDRADDYFSMWGYHSYDSTKSETVYEVTYFKGSACEMHNFLETIIDLNKRHTNEDIVVTTLAGVKVKMYKPSILTGRMILIYDPEKRVASVNSPSNLEKMLFDVEVYCDKHNIPYRQEQ